MKNNNKSKLKLFCVVLYMRKYPR